MIPVVWDELEAMLQRSIEHSKGTLDAKSLYAWLVNGDATAFATICDNRLIMTMVVMEVQYPTYKVARIIACAGKQLKESMQHIDALEAWALTRGCIEIEAWCRPSMARLAERLGWKPKFTILSRDLRGNLQ